MARTKRQPRASITTADVSDLSTSVTQDRSGEEEVNENSDQSDLESPQSPPVSKKPKIPEKRKPRKSAPAKSVPTSPAVTSSSATTPQPEPGPKRKGGNKRKWTHEYCLTCTRYGRACGGRRDGEEGCAVCRDPDRSKGEKLRECLWADHEAGITDYKTAREIFKKAQAEARAQRSKPQTKRQQSSNAAASATTPKTSVAALDSSILASNKSSIPGDLPRTSRPLDLQPPILVRSSYLTQRTESPRVNDDDTFTFDRSQLAMYSSVAGTPHDHLPRIHRPQLTYVAIDSDNEEKVLTTGQDSLSSINPQKRQGLCVSQSSNVPLSYFDADLNAWVKPIATRPSQNKSRYYTHPYRSPYDAPPAPPPHSVHLGDNSRQVEPLRRGSVDARTPGLPSSPTLDKTGSPTRKWSVDGSKIKSLNGYDWKARAWKPSNNSTDRGVANTAGGLEGRAAVTTSVSDTSSLSSYMSIDEDNIDGARAGRSDVQESGNTEGNNGVDTNSPTSHRKRKFDDTIAQSLGTIQGSNPATDAILHINLGNAISKVSAEASSRTQGNKRVTTFQQPVAVTFPGEITIQEDEEAGTSSSDSELTSDEGKLKSLPLKLRKVLSRSRITKVIIGDDIFEIRPKTKGSSSSSKAHKNSSSAGIKGKGRKQARKSNVRVEHVDESDGEEETNTNGLAQVRDEQTQINRPPIKIKLIFKPKTALVTHDASQATNRPSTAEEAAVDTSVSGDDTEMDDA